MKCFKESNKRFYDDRGFFSELFRESDYGSSCVQVNHSFNKKMHTFRGMHYQFGREHVQSKIVMPITGSIWDVVVCINPKSCDFGKHKWFFLDSTYGDKVYVDVDYAHGFLTCEANTHVVYFVDNVFTPGSDDGFRWNDPFFDIQLPIKVNPTSFTMSKKDRDWPKIKGKEDFSKCIL